VDQKTGQRRREGGLVGPARRQCSRWRAAVRFSSLAVTLVTVNQPQSANPPKLPRAICRLCKRLYHEPGAPLQWYANAHGRAVCPHCRNWLLKTTRYLTPAQVAEMLQVSAKTVSRWALQDASMPCIRLPGRVVRFEEGTLLRWLERKRQGRTVRKAGDPNSTPSSWGKSP